jgi:5-dehydro-2-deoxygluconokinase
LKSLLVTAVGADPVGEFVLNFLENEGVETGFIPKKPGTRTSAVVLGIEPPDRFPLVYYRDNCADVELTIDDAAKVPVEQAKALLVTGTGLSRDPGRTANIYLMERARTAGVTVFLDLDFRADQWQNSPAADVRAFGVTVRSLLHLTDVIFGTEEEIKAATLRDASQLSIKHSQISAPEISGDLEQAIACLTGSISRRAAGGLPASKRNLENPQASGPGEPISTRIGPEAVVVKRGAEGSTVHLSNGEVHRGEPFRVEVCNVLGAGDAYASGFIYGYLNGWNWKKCARMGNATGAILVTKHGCANFMPFESEALNFVEANGGFLEGKLTCPQ